MGSFLKKVADPQRVTLVKDTHREKAPRQIKLPRFTKSTNMNI